MEDIKLECRNCQNDLESQKGQIEIWCPKCNATLNGFGQVLEYPQGQDEGFANESYWGEENA